MVTITIDPELKKAHPAAVLGCVQCKVRVAPSGPELLEETDEVCGRLRKTLAVPDIQNRPHIASTRACYKALGKDPHRYRNSAEAMCRRVLQGKGLYRINNVVEVNNLLSIDSGYPMGAYDVDKIRGAIRWVPSGEDAHYQGIGKEQVNIAFLPVLMDMDGPFGNPTSDCVRAMITEEAKEVWMVFYCFDGEDELPGMLSRAEELLRTHCGGRDFEKTIIR